MGLITLRESQLTKPSLQGKMLFVPAHSLEAEDNATLPLGVTGNTPDSSGAPRGALAGHHVGNDVSECSQSRRTLDWQRRAKPREGKV